MLSKARQKVNVHAKEREELLSACNFTESISDWENTWSWNVDSKSS